MTPTDFDVDAYLAGRVDTAQKVQDLVSASEEKILDLEGKVYHRQSMEDGAFARGLSSTSSAIGITKDLLLQNPEEAAKKLAWANAYNKFNPSSIEGEALAKAYASGENPEAVKSFSEGIDATGRGILAVRDKFKQDLNQKGFGSVVDNLSALGGGIVAQVPNMFAPMLGMGIGAIAGAGGGPVGIGAGMWAGASAGNTLVGSPEIIARKLEQNNIDPNDLDAVTNFLKAEGNNVLKDTATKGAIIGAVDVLTLKLGNTILAKPLNDAIDRGLIKLGVDLSDASAVAAARKSPALGSLVATDDVFIAAQKGLSNKSRDLITASLEPLGEFTGELLGDAAVTGEFDVQSAALEAASAIGQSAITFAGQKAFQAIQKPFSGSSKDNYNSKEAQDLAVSTGDITPLTDPSSPTYNPVNAIAALYGNSQLDTATDDAKEANLIKANQVITDLESQKEQIENIVKPKADREAQINKYKEKLINLSPDDPNLAQKTSLINSIIAEEQTQLAEPDLTPKELKTQKDILSKINKDIAASTKALGVFNSFVTDKRDAATIIEEANLPAQVAPSADPTITSPNTSLGGSKVVSLAMRSPESISNDDANMLADNKANNLSTKERRFLKAFVSARMAENELATIGKVSKDVLNGSPEGAAIKYFGIKNYRKNIMTAIGSNNKNKADKELMQMVKFAVGHASKLKVAKLAKKQFDNAQTSRNNPAVKIGANKNGLWEIAKDGVTYDRTQFISSNSNKLLIAMEKETIAIDAALVELDSAYESKFNEETPVGLQVTTKTPPVVVPKPAIPTAEAVAPPVAEAPAKPKEVAVKENKTAPEAIVEAKIEPQIETKDVVKNSVEKTEETTKTDPENKTKPVKKESISKSREEALQLIMVEQTEVVYDGSDDNGKTITKSVNAATALKSINVKINALKELINCMGG